MSSTSSATIAEPDRAAAQEIVYPVGKHWIAQATYHSLVARDTAEAFARHIHKREKALVTTELLLLYEEGSVTKRFQPDLMVSLGLDNGLRIKSYKVWELGKPPDLVLEVASESTIKTDEGDKLRGYAEARVREYWRFDADGTLMEPPPIRGYRLNALQTYEPVPEWTDTQGVTHYWSAVVGASLRVGQQGATPVIVVEDPETGQAVLTGAAMDAAYAKRDAEAIEAEKAQRAAEEAQRTETEKRRVAEQAQRIAEGRRRASEKRVRRAAELLAELGYEGEI